MMDGPLVITLGCRLNAYESEVIKAYAVAAGLRRAVVVNSCAVTGEAERQTRQAIRKARRENPDFLMIVTGCAAQIHPGKFAAMEEVDAVVGNAEKLMAQTYIDLKEKKDRKPDLLPRCDDAPIPPFVEGYEGLTRGFVPVQFGCDHACTFCIIPQGRGASRSVAPERVVEQVRRLALSQYPEMTLTGVDIASYDAGGLRLGGLAKRLLAEVPELKRLRLSSLDPAAMDADLWDIIGNEPRLMPCLHLSVQSGDDMILKRMKRRHTRKDVYELVAKARGLRPDMAFGADIIAGFPTEDPEMFESTRLMLEELDFTWLHVFPYSARTGTPAAKMPQVKAALRKERAAVLRNLGKKAVERHLKGLVGQRLSLHVEGVALGRAPSFAEVVLTSPQIVGSVVVAEIVGVEGDRAIGKV